VFFERSRIGGEQREFTQHGKSDLIRNARPQLGEDRAGYLNNQSSVHAARKRREPRLRKEFVNRRNLPQKLRLLGRKSLLGTCFHALISAHPPSPGNEPFCGRQAGRNV
jgi:hypothetical protein